MHAPDIRDVIVGIALAACGGWMAWYSATNYNVGTIHQMGPGMFPMGLGFLLVGFGMMITLPALARGGRLPTVEFRPGLAVLLAVASFAVALERIGLVPSILLMTVIAASADNKLGIRGGVLLGAALGLGSYLVFHLGLGLSIPVFRWPFP